MPQSILNIRPGAPAAKYTVFISSGDDALRIRDRISNLIEQVFNPVLDQAKWPIVLFPDRWERTAPHQLEAESPNAQFVRRACESHLTIVVLIDEMRPGTQEEFEAVLAEGGVEVAVLRFSEKSKGSSRRDKLGQLLRSHASEIFLRSTNGGPDDEDAWFELVRVLLALILSVQPAQDQGEYAETR